MKPYTPHEFKVQCVRECEPMTDLADNPEIVAQYWRNNIPQADWFDPMKEALVVLVLNTRKRIFDKLVKEKRAKGYTEGEAGTPYQHSDQQPSGILPQLLNAIDEEQVLRLIQDDNYCMQEKHDGRRLIVQKQGQNITGINKKGNTVGLSLPVFDVVRGFDADVTIDGESIGDNLFAFDLLELDGVDIRSWPYRERLAALMNLLFSVQQRTIKLVETAFTAEQKLALLNELKAGKREGIVFKQVYSPYTPGRCLFAANTFKFDLKESVNLSRQKFLEWNGFLQGECLMAVKTDKSNSGWVKLTTPRWECIVKQIDGQFPNWRQVVPNNTETWTKVMLSEAAIKQMLNLSSKLPGDDNENRTLQLRVDKELHLEGRNKDDKEFTSAQIADVKITGKSVITALNREYLQTALRCGLNEIRIHTELEPLLFLKPGKRLVVMPVRLNGPTTQTVPAKPQPAPKPEPTATTPEPKAEAQPERKTEMPKATAKPEAPKAPEASTSLLDQIEQVKESAKNLVRDLTGLTDVVKQAEKDRRVNEKELENARAVLKKLQQVQI